MKSEISSAELELLKLLAVEFERLGFRWYVMGAQAALFHGAQRSTNDIDITVLDALNRRAELVGLLRSVGCTLRVDDDDFHARTRVIPAQLSEGLGLDVVLGADPLEEQFAARAARVEVDGVSLNIASAEDVIVMKLLAGRPRDLGDVSEVVRAARALDLKYLRGLLALLEEGLGRDDLLEPLEHALRAYNGT